MAREAETFLMAPCLLSAILRNLVAKNGCDRVIQRTRLFQAFAAPALSR